MALLFAGSGAGWLVRSCRYKEIHCSLIKICCPFLVKSATIYMVFTKVPDADLLREGLRSLSFYLNKDSIMVYGWTIKRSGDGQDKES